MYHWHRISVQVTFENITAVSQNSLFLSGRSPGNTLQSITLRNVQVTIDRWPDWNYSHPDHDYTPTSALWNDRIPALTDGIYVEDVEGLCIEGGVVTFAPARYQDYWSMVCVNTTNNAGHTQVITGLACNNDQ